jgi:hypothetical protein
MPLWLNFERQELGSLNKYIAMKKLVASAAFILLLSGVSAAQTKTSPKAITKKTEQKEAKKGCDKIVSISSHQAKQDSAIFVPVKLDMINAGADTTVVPKVRNVE